MPEKYIQLPGLEGNYKLVNANNSLGCVDPRWWIDPSQVNPEITEKIGITQDLVSPHDVGAIRYPGASIGDAMTLVSATKISGERAVEIVQRFDGENFTFHGDDHGPNHDCLGCGHFDRACLPENSPKYGVDHRLVRSIKDVGLRSATPKRVPILSGKHKEVGVIVVQGSDFTVKPVSGDNELFRYDQTRYEQRLRNLGLFARDNGLNVSYDLLLETSTRQRNATLELLAKGLPVYDVDLTDVNFPRVRQIGLIE